ncbi:MAG: hypothetical protein E6J46_12410 [Chloroflexi bacterium]|nr:MAG: hypothetical protein E6J46_12410 [Chloroflexota bacterium]
MLKSAADVDTGIRHREQRRDRARVVRYDLETALAFSAALEVGGIRARARVGVVDHPAQGSFS